MSRLRLSPAAVAALAVTILSTLFAPTRAGAQDLNERTTLAGRTQADRVQMLRDEFRERRAEIREQAERARLAKKHPGRVHGRKAEPAMRDADLVRGGLTRSASPARIDQALVAPTNVKANNKAGDAANAGQAEQAIAMLGQNGLCAWNDGQGFNTPPDVQGYGYTTDGGASWTDGGVPPRPATISSWSSDPSVTVNEKTGAFFYCGLTTNPTSTNGVGVARGHFSGASFIWDNESVVAVGPNATQGFDKQWIAADSSNGNLYVTWTLFVPGSDAVFFSRSIDNGATWSPPLQISGAWENGAVSGSRPAVGPNGEVYVTYSAIGPVDADSIKIAKSVDGGLTFGPSVVSGIVYDNYFTGAPGFNRPRAVTFPGIAVDRSTGPNRGRVYETWQDCVDFYADPIGGGTSKSEVEVNSGFANATPFTIGQTLRGSISASTDQDWWSFPATQGTTYIFYVDSLRSTSFRYTLRLYCPNDTIALSRLAFSGAQSTTSAQNSHSLIVWTAPTTNTYYLRMVPVTVGAGANNYRIQTATHVVTAFDVARDTRDVMVVSSANGVTGWSPRTRVNDDAPLYDNWLPEVAVPCDGNAYVEWFDWRDTPASCFGGSNIYLSRSTNGGGAWAPNQVATTAVTGNWTQVASNIAPNQGDYNGIYGGDCVAMAFADGRLGDSDVFTARLATDFSVNGCPGDQTVLAGTTQNNPVTVNNANQMFDNTYTYTLTVSANWPGYPASGSVNAAALGSANIGANISVPDSAAHGEVVQACLTVSLNGACVMQCCWNVNVINPATAVLASLAKATAEPGAVHLTWSLATAQTAVVQRSDDGTTWNRIGDVTPDGTGMASFTDLSVRAGATYSYRLGFVADGHTEYAGEARVTVPLGAEFALHSVGPNPASNGFSVTFSLPRAAAASVEVMDLAGRRVIAKDVTSFGIGRHTVSLQSETARLAAGVYSVRLLQDGRIATRQVSVVR